MKQIINKMGKVFFPFILLIFTSISCKENDTEFTDVEKKKVEKEVNQTLKNYYSDIKKEGLTAEFRYLDNSEDFYWLPPGFSNAISYDSVKLILNQNAPLFQSVNNSWDTLKVMPLNSELASYSGRLNSKMIDKSGKVSESVLLETGILIKRKNGWKLLSGQTALLK